MVGALPAGTRPRRHRRHPAPHPHGLAAIDATPPRTRTATPQQAFDMQARMLGERNDP